MLVPIAIESNDVLGSVDEVRQLGRPTPSDGIAVGSYVTVRGWILNRADGTPLKNLRVGIDALSPSGAILGIERTDVRDSHGANALKSGFLAVLPVTAPPGRHELVFGFDTNDQRRELIVSAALTTESPVDPLEGLVHERAGWEFALDGVFDGNSALDQDSDGVFVCPTERPVAIRGWALHGPTGAAAREVVARSGGRYLHVLAPQARPDVAAIKAAPHAVDCGFTIPLLPSHIGVEEIALFALREDGSYGSLARVRVRQARPLASWTLPESDAVAGTVDAIALDDRTLDSLNEINAVEGQVLRVRGWAVDTMGPLLTGGIELTLDDVAVVQTQTSLTRQDIATKYHGLTDAGFEIAWTIAALAPGAHLLGVRALSARRDAVATLAMCRFFVEPAPQRSR